MSWWKKDSVELKAAKAASEVLAEFLSLQVLMGTRDRELSEQTERLEDAWAKGYVLGAIDAVFQTLDVVHESEYGIAVALNVFRLVYGEADGEAKYWQAIERQSDPTQQAGMMVGGTEALRAITGEKTGVMGLGHFLWDGTKRAPKQV